MRRRAADKAARQRATRNDDPPDGKIEMSCNHNSTRRASGMSRALRAFRQAFVREKAS